MWYHKFSKEQFTLYILLEARLSKAYWLSSLHEDRSDNEKHTQHLRLKLAHLENEIEQLLCTVHADAIGLDGEISKLMRLCINYIEDSARSNLSLSNSRILRNVIGVEETEIPMAEVANDLALGRAYMNHRADIIDSDCLEAVYNKGLAICYDLIGDNFLSDEFTEDSDKQRIDRLTAQVLTAEKLLKPSLKVIRKECGDCAAHLTLRTNQRRELAVAMTNNTQDVFNTGLMMLRCATDLINNRYSVDLSINGANVTESTTADGSQDEIAVMSSRLVKVSLICCDTILEHLEVSNST